MSTLSEPQWATKYKPGCTLNEPLQNNFTLTVKPKLCKPTKMLKKQEKKVVKQALTLYLGRKPSFSDYCKVVSTINGGDYFYLMYDNRLLGKVERLGNEITFKPAMKWKKNIGASQTS